MMSRSSVHSRFPATGPSRPPRSHGENRPAVAISAKAAMAGRPCRSDRP